MNIPTITTILTSATEATDIKTITFRYPKAVIPGQFFMIWIPGVDEIAKSVYEDRTGTDSNSQENIFFSSAVEPELRCLRQLLNKHEKEN
jgi:NAD(P)H-flavin reductase